MAYSFFHYLSDYIKHPQKRYYYHTVAGFHKNESDYDAVSKLYRSRLGKIPNLENPQTFNEKINWLKLYYHDPRYTILSDKYLVKDYISKTLGEQYIIPTLGVWDSFDEIDFDKLPDSFVLKCNHDSGSIAIVRNKANLNLEKLRKKFSKGLKRDYSITNRQWCYKNIDRKIIAEKYMGALNEDLTDYKFFCFNGEPLYLYISTGLEDHSTARISFYNMDLTPAPFYRNDFKPFDESPQFPKHLEEMKEIAGKLSSGIPFVRVDLYEIDDRIYFSEMTFYPCAGYLPFEPEEWDLELGKLLTLPEDKIL
ncbi:MAG: glycosyl transferase [Lachnospiraceae bacterium]|nr:glycosyl transferase [Lachnospiraceae bacterium]